MSKKRRLSKPRPSRRPPNQPNVAASSSAVASHQHANAAYEEFARAARRSKRSPNDFGAQARLVQTSLQAAEYEACRQAAQRLVYRWPDRVDGRLIAAQAWETMGNLSAAADALHTENGLAGLPPEILIRYAHLMERLHRLDDALAALAEVPRNASSHHAAELTRSEVFYRQRKFEAAVELLQPLVDTQSEDQLLAIQAGYALARCLDRISEFSLAFGVLLQTKAKQRNERLKWIETARQSVLQHLDLARNLEAKHLVTDTSIAEEQRVHLLGGFPRSGTTLIESALSQHGQLATLEETPIFTQSALHPLTQRYGALGGPIKMLESMSHADIDQTRQTYLRRAGEFLNCNLDNVVLIDKNPILTPAAPFFLRVFPAARVIICCRDPRDVLLSNFFLYPGELNSFNSQHLNLNDLAKWLQLHWNCSLRMREVRPEKISFVRYEDAIHNFDTTLRSMLQFLNLTWDANVLDYRLRAGDRPARSPSYAEVTQPLYSHAIGRWKNYAEMLEPALPHLMSAIASWDSDVPSFAS